MLNLLPNNDFVNRDVEQFIEMLFENKEPDEGKILIWTLKNKTSRWFDTADETSAYVEKIKKQDVYVGCGISPEGFGRNKRCSADKIIGLPGFYADIDIVDPVHKKQNLPETIDEAVDLVNGYGFDPSIIVDTGHGIHAWWLFNEIWDLTKDTERQKAAEFSRRLSRTIKNRCAKKGWDLDSVFDLARVLRVPGTMNCKGKPVRAEIIAVKENRYEPMDLEEFLDPDVPQEQPSLFQGKNVDGEFTLDPNANPPVEKLDALKEIEPRFAAAWAGTRKDLASPSEYDLSLANFAVQAEWSDQEIVNLIIAWRRMHGHDVKKSLRKNYLKRTIRKAREPNQIEAEAKKLKAASESGNFEKIRDSLSKHLGIEVVSIKKFLCEPHTFVLETTVGRVDLGVISGLIDQKPFRHHVASATGRVIPDFPGVRAIKKHGSLPPWREIAQGMLDICEVVEVGPEGTDAGELDGWLCHYARRMGMISNMSFADADRESGMLMRNKKPHVFLRDFNRYVKSAYDEFFSARAMASRLRKYGAVHKAIPLVSTDDDGLVTKTTRSMWELPKSPQHYLK